MRHDVVESGRLPQEDSPASAGPWRPWRTSGNERPKLGSSVATRRSTRRAPVSDRVRDPLGPSRSPRTRRRGVGLPCASRSQPRRATPGGARPRFPFRSRHRARYPLRSRLRHRPQPRHLARHPLRSRLRRRPSPGRPRPRSSRKAAADHLPRPTAPRPPAPRRRSIGRETRRGTICARPRPRPQQRTPIPSLSMSRHPRLAAARGGRSDAGTPRVLVLCRRRLAATTGRRERPPLTGTLRPAVGSASGWPTTPIATWARAWPSSSSASRSRIGSAPLV